MGTRGLTAVIKNNKPVVAQYGQWDHYPEGQGSTIVDFLRTMDIDKFNVQVDKCRWITEAEGEKIQKEHADNWDKVYPQLYRDMGGEVLEWVYNQKTPEIILKDSWDFIKDSLFCEWAYIIDLDKGMFQVCQGFQTEATEGNPYGTDAESGSSKEYYPCKPLIEWPLNDIPKNWVKEVMVASGEEEED